MDVIDLDFIGNTENPYGYFMGYDLSNYSTTVVPEVTSIKGVSIQDEIKDIKEQIADIYNQLEKLKRPLRCKSLL